MIASFMERPMVGIGVIVIKDDKVLLGKRKNTHGEGRWCFPGGHLEFNEELEDCAIREVGEETGLKIENIKFFTITNDIFTKEKKHYITIFMVSDYDSGNVELKEPDKFEKWGWFSWDKLPEPLFLPIENLLKKDISPFEN